MKKIILACLGIMLIINSNFSNYAVTDTSILSEPVDRTYNSREISPTISKNIDFIDLPATHWAKEAVTRLGSLDVIKGYSNGSYQPNNNVSKEEVLTAILRVVGMEDEALLEAENLAIANPTDKSIYNNWARGYLQVASDIGLITAAELADGLSADLSGLDPAVNFIRTSSVSREQTAKWIVQAIGNNNPNLLPPIYQAQAINSYNDVSEMGAEFAPYVEAMVRKQYMVGSDNSFNPKGTLKRSELAQIIKNMDSVLYTTLGVTKKAGVVAAITDENKLGAQKDIFQRSFIVRTEEGKVDQLRLEYQEQADLTNILKDTPVYRSGIVSSMMTLKEGEAIEYLVNNTTNELFYINSRGSVSGLTITGVLQSLTQLSSGKITIKDDQGILNTYPMKASLYDVATGTIKIDGFSYKVSNAPVSHQVNLVITDNVITEIKHAGDEIVVLETSGIVKENNVALSSITIIDWNGKEVTKKFIKSQLLVEKQNYYDAEDEIGYLDEMFPDYSFDERDSTIDAIEAGDIVHLRMDPNNTQYVTMISAKTNYIVKMGAVQNIAYKGAEGAAVTIIFDDLSTAIYDVPGTIPVLKDGKNVSLYTLVAGDLVKMLINEAVIQPGEVRESVKEIVIDHYGNTIMNVYKGDLGAVNNNQETLSVTHIYTLTKTGWGNYSTAKVFDISGKNIEYYENDQRISLDYAQKYLKMQDVETYVATTSDSGKEQIKKVTFRKERDSVLEYTNVTYSNGLDQIKLLSQAKPIQVDNGTIVIKNGKLVQATSILAPDYTHVVLNGDAYAAIVQIEQEPNNSAISVFRGRIGSIEDFESFQLQSHAILKGMTWVYSPIPRIFNTTEDTLIFDEKGAVPYNEFIGYSEISKVDEVYTIIAEGLDAKVVIKNPYAQEGVKGQIYSNADSKIMIKDVLVYSNADSKWNPLSLSNSYAQVDWLKNTVIIKNNQVITLDQLEIGDTIRVMTQEKLVELLQTESKRDVDGIIIFVEN